MTCLVCRMGELGDSTIFDDVMVSFYSIEKVLREAEEYLLNINAPYIASTFPLIRKAYERGVKGRFIHTRDFGPHPIIEEHYKKGRDRIPPSMLSTHLEERLWNEMEIVLYMSEKEVALLAFPKKDGSFDFHGFSSKDPRTHRWCSELFQHYWERAKPLNPY